MDSYRIEYEPGWDKCFQKLDASIQNRIFKKILQLQTGIRSRHLKHGSPHFVEEIGSYRVGYKQYDSTGVRMICFAGSHKDYEKWYRNQN